jgi:colanic acid biosynthesis glycosyl transferase WcaI
MRVMIFGALYEPDLGPSAPLFTLLCENLVRLGHEVTIITFSPSDSTGRVLDNYRGKLFWRSKENGVNVIRVTQPYFDRSKLPLRMLQNICYQLGAALAGLGQRFDVVMAASSSLTAWLPFATMVVLPRKPAIYSVYDVYPKVGIKLGVFRNKLVIQLVSAMERFCLKNAVIVRIISNSFRPDLRALGVPDEKMVLVYDWVDTSLIRPLPRDNAFAREQNLTGQFVVLFAGNLGLSQGLMDVLVTAEILINHKDVTFVFVGDGAYRQQLVTAAERRHLTNVKFIPFQPRQRLPEVLASADVSLISLQRSIGFSSMPSKTFSILASGRPVIACVDEGCEAWNLVTRAEAGLCVPPENPSALSEAILILKKDLILRQQMGRNGRDWVVKHHSPLSGAKQIERIMMDICSRNMT